jgi:hypothetical protein
MIQRVVQGGEVTLDANFVNGVGQLEDADPVRIDIIDPNDVEVVADAAPTSHPSTGLYAYTWEAPEDATLGLWGIRWSGVMDGEPLDPQIEYFEVIAPGSIIIIDGAFATLDEFEARKGDVEADQEEIVSTLLVDATALIKAEAEGSTAEWVVGSDPAPVLIKSICIEAAYRAWANPDALSQSSIADSSISYTRDGIPDALFLTAAEKRAVHRAAGSSAALSVTLVSPYSGDVEDDLELNLGDD